MQSLEAMISLLFFVSVLSHMLGGISEKPAIDDSLYRYQLAEDVWRVEQLRGHFEDFSDAKRMPIEADFDIISQKTKLCIYMHGIEITSCRGKQYSIQERLATINRVVYKNDFAENVTLTIAKSG